MKQLGKFSSFEKLRPILHQAIKDNKENKGILVFGPPGVGKSYSKFYLRDFEGHDLIYSNASDQLYPNSQLSVERIQQNYQGGPTLFFIDDITNLQYVKPDRSHQIMQILHDLQAKGVLLITSTSIPHRMTPQQLQMFPIRVYYPFPDRDDRLAYLRNQAKESELTENDLQNLASKTEQWSYADMSVLSRDASYEPLREMTKITLFKKEVSNNGAKWIPLIDKQDQDPNYEFKSCHFTDLRSDSILLRSPTMSDYTKVLSTRNLSSSSLTPKELLYYQQFESMSQPM